MSNPIFQMFNQQQLQKTQKINNLDELMTGVRSGSINPKDEVINALQKMSPQQKTQIRAKLPFLQKFIGNTPALQEFQSCLR